MTADFKTEVRLGPFSVGEKPEPLLITFTDVDGTAINLNGYDSDFVVEAVDQTVTGLGVGTATLNTDGTDGVVKYTWGAADFATAGFFRAQMWVGNGTNRYASCVYSFFVNIDTTAPSI